MMQSVVFVFIFAAVLAGAYVTTTLIARRSFRTGKMKRFEVVERMGIDRTHAVVLVRFSDKHYLLGIGPQGVTLIDEVDAEAAGMPARAGEAAGMPLMDAFDALRAKVSPAAFFGSFKEKRPDAPPESAPLDEMELRLLERSRRIQRHDAETDKNRT